MSGERVRSRFEYVKATLADLRVTAWWELDFSEQRALLIEIRDIAQVRIDELAAVCGQPEATK